MINPPTKHLRKGHIYQLFDGHIPQTFSVGSRAFFHHHRKLLLHYNLFVTENFKDIEPADPPSDSDVYLEQKIADISGQQHCALMFYYKYDTKLDGTYYHIMVVNSGLGIHNNHKYHYLQGTDNILYNLWQCYIIHESVLQKIVKFVLLRKKEFYKFHWEHCSVQHSNNKEVDKAINESYLKTLQEYVAFIEPYYDYLMDDDRIKTNIAYLKEVKNYPATCIDTIKSHLEKVCSYIKIHYWKILYALIGKVQITTKEFYTPLNSFKEDVFETKVKEFVSKWNKSKKGWKHRTFVYHEGDLFTEKQESGSCCWFSLLWLSFINYLQENNGTLAYLQYEKMMTEFIKDLNRDQRYGYNVEGKSCAAVKKLAVKLNYLKDDYDQYHRWMNRFVLPEPHFAKHTSKSQNQYQSTPKIITLKRYKVWKLLTKEPVKESLPKKKDDHITIQDILTALIYKSHQNSDSEKLLPDLKDVWTCRYVKSHHDDKLAYRNLQEHILSFLYGNSSVAISLRPRDILNLIWYINEYDDSCELYETLQLGDCADLDNDGDNWKYMSDIFIFFKQWDNNETMLEKLKNSKYPKYGYPLLNSHHNKKKIISIANVNVLDIVLITEIISCNTIHGIFPYTFYSTRNIPAVPTGVHPYLEDTIFMNFLNIVCATSKTPMKQKQLRHILDSFIKYYVINKIQNAPTNSSFFQIRPMLKKLLHLYHNKFTHSTLLHFVNNPKDDVKYYTIDGVQFELIQPPIMIDICENDSNAAEILSKVEQYYEDFTSPDPVTLILNKYSKKIQNPQQTYKYMEKLPDFFNEGVYFFNKSDNFFVPKKGEFCLTYTHISDTYERLKSVEKAIFLKNTQEQTFEQRFEAATKAILADKAPTIIANVSSNEDKLLVLDILQENAFADVAVAQTILDGNENEEYIIVPDPSPKDYPFMVMIPYNIPYFVCHKKDHEHVYKVWMYPLVLNQNNKLPNDDAYNYTAEGLFHPEYDSTDECKSSEWYCFNVSNNFLTFEFKESRGELLRDVLTRSFYQNGGTIFLQHVLDITDSDMSTESKGYPDLSNIRDYPHDTVKGTNCCRDDNDPCEVTLGTEIKTILNSAHAAFNCYFDSWQDDTDMDHRNVDENLKKKFKGVISNTTIQTFIDTLKRCKFTDVIKSSDIEINQIIRKIITHRQVLSNQLIDNKIYNFKGLNHIDQTHIQTLTQIMILNQLLGDVYTLQKICNDIVYNDSDSEKQNEHIDKINEQKKCKDIYKLRLLQQSFNAEDLVYGKTPSTDDATGHSFTSTRAEFIFQIMFGNLIRKDQWDKYNNIILSHDSNTSKVFQFLMGKGKSSVITPLLILYFMDYKHQHRVKTIYLIVPIQLIRQAKQDLFQLKLFFGLKEDTFQIITDAEIKNRFLESGEGIFKNSVFIIDEFDSLYDPLQSNFNVVQNISPKNVFTNEHINYIIGYVLKEAQLNIENDIYITCNDPIFRLYTRILLDGVLNLKANQHYGMSKLCDSNGTNDKWNSRIAIPYLRKDTPMEGSSFSSEIISLALTIQYKLRNNTIQFEPEDILFMIFYFEKADDQDALITIVYNTDDNTDKSITTQVEDLSKILNGKSYITAEIGDRYYSLMKTVANNINNNNIFLLFDLLTRFMCLVNKFKIKESILNCSFLDIIGMHHIYFQSGFTGTVNIEMLYYPPRTGCKNFSDTIEYDYDEKLSVYTAFMGLVDTNEVIHISNGEDIYNYITNHAERYHMLIDAAGLFIDESNYNIVNVIAAKVKTNPSREYVYLDEDDNKKVYKEGNSTDYTGRVRDDAFYYYSQKNIIGVDFRQPTNMRGLLIVDKSLSYTNMAQAIYRARKLNGGHIMDIIYHKTSAEERIPTKEELYTHMVDNDSDLINARHNLLRSQALKYMIRSELSYSGSQYRYDNSFYQENNVAPIFINVSRDTTNTDETVSRDTTNTDETVSRDTTNTDECNLMTTTKIKDISSQFGTIIEHFEYLNADIKLTQLRRCIKGETQMIAVIDRIDTLCKDTKVKEICKLYKQMLDAAKQCKNFYKDECIKTVQTLYNAEKHPYFDDIITSGEFNTNFLDMYDNNSTYSMWKDRNKGVASEDAKTTGKLSAQTFIESLHKELYDPIIAKQLCLGLSGGPNTEQQQQKQAQQQTMRQINRHLQRVQEEHGIPLMPFVNYSIPHQTFYNMSDEELDRETFVLDQDNDNILAVSYSIFDESFGKRVSSAGYLSRIPTYIKVQNLLEKPDLMGVYKKMECKINGRFVWKHTNIHNNNYGWSIANVDTETNGWVLFYHDRQWNINKWSHIQQFKDNHITKEYKVLTYVSIDCAFDSPPSMDTQVFTWYVWHTGKWQPTPMSIYECNLQDERIDIERSHYLTSDARVLRLQKDGEHKNKTWWIITKRTCCQYMLRLGLQLTLQKTMCNNHLMNIPKTPPIPNFIRPIFGDCNDTTPNVETVNILCYISKKYDLMSNTYVYTKEVETFIKTKILDHRRRDFKTFKSNYITNCNNYPYLDCEHGFAQHEDNDDDTTESAEEKKEEDDVD